jgi:hypothetical protein
VGKKGVFHQGVRVYVYVYKYVSVCMYVYACVRMYVCTYVCSPGLNF